MTPSKFARRLTCAQPGCFRQLVHVQTKACGRDQFCSIHDGRNDPLACTCQNPQPHRIVNLTGCRRCKRVIL